MANQFKPGQKVVCIYDKNQFNDTMVIRLDKIKEGVEYTVRGIANNGSGILLCGITGGYWGTGNEAGYAPYRFAPIQEQRERINYVAVSETLREVAIETVITQTN